jgi:hypothetical protein
MHRTVTMAAAALIPHSDDEVFREHRIDGSGYNPLAMFYFYRDASEMSSR